MSLQQGWFLLVLACGMSACTSVYAESHAKAACPHEFPQPFATGQPFVLNDPRSGLTLYVESDGRHMAAITPAGKMIWHKNLFDDPELEMLFPPPPPLAGTESPSSEEWHRQVLFYIGELSIDRIAVEPDCDLEFIDHGRSPRFLGHYIFAGSGNKIFWLLDAKTGDFEMEVTN